MTAVLKPIYQQITERLERDIRGGKYAAGQKFPSEAALIKRFAASRITVGRAVRELQQRGLLDRVAGSGTYLRGARNERRGGLLFCQVIAASPDAAAHALLWTHAEQRTASKEEQAVELARHSLTRGVAGIFFAP